MTDSEIIIELAKLIAERKDAKHQQLNRINKRILTLSRLLKSR